MVADDSKSADELLADLDAQYEPIDALGEWASGIRFDADSWNREFGELETAKAEAGESSVKLAFDKLVQAVALDTGAIEGLYELEEGITVTILSGVAAVESVLRKTDEDVRELFEAQLLGYQMVLDVATRARPITQTSIRELHAAMCAPQETCRAWSPIQGNVDRPFEKGAYKTLPNHVWQPDGTYFSYCPVDQVRFEMDRLLVQLTAPEFEEAHVIVQAAYAHYSFTRIHPFQDGNGRVARALCSLWLFRVASIPFFLLTDQRTRYLQVLRAADSGDVQSYVDFFFDHAIRAVRMTRQLLARRDPEEIARRVRRIADLARSHGGLEHTELDNTAAAVLQAAVESAQEQREKFHAPGRIDINVAGTNQSKGNEPEMYRRPARVPHNSFNLQFRNAAPFAVVVNRLVEVFVLRPEDDATRDVFLLRGTGQGTELPIALAEAHPRIDTVLGVSISVWLERIFAEALEELERNARKALGQSPYA